jgi:hypothetical protein
MLFPTVVVSQPFSLAHTHIRDLFVEHRATIYAGAKEFLRF